MRLLSFLLLLVLTAFCLGCGSSEPSFQDRGEAGPDTADEEGAEEEDVE